MYLRDNKGANVEHCGTPEITCLVMEQWSNGVYHKEQVLPRGYHD